MRTLFLFATSAAAFQGYQGQGCPPNAGCNPTEKEEMRRALNIPRVSKENCHLLLDYIKDGNAGTAGTRTYKEVKLVPASHAIMMKQLQSLPILSCASCATTYHIHCNEEHTEQTHTAYNSLHHAHPHPAPYHLDVTTLPSTKICICGNTNMYKDMASATAAGWTASDWHEMCIFGTTMYMANSGGSHPPPYSCPQNDQHHIDASAFALDLLHHHRDGITCNDVATQTCHSGAGHSGHSD